ncbi:MAG TPA: lipid-binding SYLF domain-containing protein [Vicinamibacterales bacterium]|nr:lipid-binding SYLF domain-containing protein [Vicinamibacterales bacterium]
MKKIVTLSGVLCVIASMSFAKLSGDEEKRLREASTVVNELRSAPDQGIPQDLWNKAQCVVVIPSMKKAAFVVGGEYGSGVMSCRTAGDWSAPVFMQLAKGSVGFQIGAQETDLVLLIMNRRGLEKLLSDKVSLGADASIAAGPVGRTASAATDAQLSAEILSYSRSQGLFAGINLSGGTLKPDKEANVRAYGSNVAVRDIAVGVDHPALAPAAPFLSSLRQSSTAAPAN